MEDKFYARAIKNDVVNKICFNLLFMSYSSLSQIYASNTKKNSY